MVKKVVVWDKIAVNGLNHAYNYLLEKAPSSAEKVQNSIIKTIKSLPDNPEVFQQDRFKKNNDGTYRAFEKFGYRIAYWIKKEEIRILRIRHSSRKPLKY